MSKEIYRLDKVGKYYHYQNDQNLVSSNVSIGVSKVSISFYQNEFVALVGKSGSGKSTLLNILSGLDTFEQGEMYFNGVATSGYSTYDWERFRANYVGFIFQNYNLIDSYTVYQNIMLALESQNYNKLERKQKVLELIDKVGLNHRKNAKCSTLSGGEKQRVAIARAIAKNSAVIVADEPTANLDSETGKQIIKLISSLSESKLVIMVTHDASEIVDYATRVITLSDGEIAGDILTKIKPKESEVTLTSVKSVTFWDNFRIVGRNLLATPKKNIFILILFIALSFLLFLSYSNSIASSRTNDESISGSVLYSGVASDRAIVTKKDNSYFTPEEISYLKSTVGYYNVIEKVDFFFNEGVESYYTNFSDFLNPSDLSEGRLPTAYNEVVVSSDSYKKIFNPDLENHSEDEFISVPYTSILNDNRDEKFIIVGKTKEPNFTVYYSTLVLDKLSPSNKVSFNAKEKQLSISYTSYSNNEVTIPSSYSFQSFPNLTNEIKVPAYLTDIIGNQITLKFRYYDAVVERVFKVSAATELVDNNPDFFSNNIQINPNELKSIEDELNQILAIPGRVVSINLPTRTSYVQFKNDLNTSLYQLYYPSDAPDLFSNIINGIQLVGGIFTILIISLVAFLIIYLTTRNLFKNRIKDFEIYMSLGINSSNIVLITTLESLIIAVLGFIISTIGCLVIINSFPKLDIAANLLLITFPEYLLIFLATLLTSFLIVRRIQKRIFKFSVTNIITTGGEILD